MDKRTSDLLSGIPKHADYAADAGSLDPEDIPQDRMDDVRDLLLNADDEVVRFFAAKLLTSWGDYEGFVALTKIMERPEVIKDIYPHRLYGYDDTYRQILMAILTYFATLADRGEKEVARKQIYLPLSKIIAMASSMRFEISNIFDFVKRKGYLEYVPCIEQHLALIIDRPETHRWKIYDALQFLMIFNSDFVVSLLIERGKAIDDFRLDRRR